MTLTNSIVQIEADTGPLAMPEILPLPTLPHVPAINELPPLDALPELNVVAPVQQPRKIRGRVVAVLILLVAGGAYAAQQGLLPV